MGFPSKTHIFARTAHIQSEEHTYTRTHTYTHLYIQQTLFYNRKCVFGIPVLKVYVYRHVLSLCVVAISPECAFTCDCASKGQNITSQRTRVDMRCEYEMGRPKDDALRTVVRMVAQEVSLMWGRMCAVWRVRNKLCGVGRWIAKLVLVGCSQIVWGGVCLFACVGRASICNATNGRSIV